MAFRSADESANEQYKRATADNIDTSGLKIGHDHYYDGLPTSLFVCFYCDQELALSSTT
jgi:hypothetical protein